MNPQRPNNNKTANNYYTTNTNPVKRHRLTEILPSNYINNSSNKSILKPPQRKQNIHNKGPPNLTPYHYNIPTNMDNNNNINDIHNEYYLDSKDEIHQYNSRLIRGKDGSTKLPTRNTNDPELFKLPQILKIVSLNNQVTLGMDLTSLGGLDLNCPDVLYHTFESPWSDVYNKHKGYKIPESYKFGMTNPLNKLEFFRMFNIKSLFCCFYGMPLDAMQIFAAMELYKNKWIYHTQLQIWLTYNINDININKINNNNNDDNIGYDNIKLDQLTSNDIYFFDVNAWEIKPFAKQFNLDWRNEIKYLLSHDEITKNFKECHNSLSKQNQ